MNPLIEFNKKQIEKLRDKITALHEMYKKVPATKCLESYCGDWCCTKLASSKDEQGNFMSLPLIYSIEYYSIAEYVLKHFSPDEQEAFFNPDKKTEKCVFRKSGKNGGCSIYPVRPFSCRTYGRSVPDIFWGLQYPKGSARAVDCPDCVHMDCSNEKKFIAEYPLMWDTLRQLSQGLISVPELGKEIVKEISGNDEFMILGWQERNKLLSENKNWFKSCFKKWWKTFSQLL